MTKSIYFYGDQAVFSPNVFVWPNSFSTNLYVFVYDYN